MPVVINDFEVLPDTETPPQASRADAAESSAPEKAETEHVLLHWQERAERVRAH